MKKRERWFWIAFGLVLGAAAAAFFGTTARPVLANTDRHDDYVMTTGPIMAGPGMTADVVWLLDYRAGKLLGTIVDRNMGKAVPWTELDLIQEFGLAPKQDVHFMMVTGTPMAGQATLYLTEINSGKFGVYSIGPRRDGQPGLGILRHDQTTFRP